MSTGGLSRARLARMHDVMAGYVERGDVPGIRPMPAPGTDTPSRRTPLRTAHPVTEAAKRHQRAVGDRLDAPVAGP